MKRAFTVAAILFVLGVAGCGGESRVQSTDASQPTTPAEVAAPTLPPPGQVGVGVPMPSFIATGLDGERYPLSGPSDKVRLVNIWATWCGPCRYEIPALVAMQSEHGADGLQVIGVSIDSAQAADQVRSFVEARGINYTIAHDPEGAIVDLLGTPVIPTTALIDRKGTIVWYHKGIVRAGDPELVKALDSVL